MGSKLTKKYKPPSINRDNWHYPTNPKRIAKPEHGRFQRLVNNLTNQEVEQYEMVFDELAELQHYVDLFSWREREECIVNTRYFNCDQSKEYCNTSYRAKVYIDHIPVRLSDIQDIPYPQNLYLLFSSLQGFQKLYQIVGYFKIIEDFICMDKDGKVKVWFNSDLSKCTLSNYHSGSNEECRSDVYEQRMVDEIVKLIEENTTEEIEAEMGVSDYIRMKHRGKGLGFKKCREEIINYAQKYQVNIPNYFESVIGIFEDEVEDNDKSIRQNSTPQYHTQEVRSIEPEQQYRNQVEVYNSGSIINRGFHQDKVTNTANNFSSFNRVPSYQQMMSKQMEQRPTSSFFSNQYQSQNAQTQNNFMSTHYPRAQSPIDKLPPALPTNPNSNFSFTYQRPSNQLVQKRSEVTKAASFHTNNAVPTALNKQLPTQSSCVALHGNNNYKDTSNGLKCTASLRDLFLDKRLVYSDSWSSYQLDAELIEDMIRYQIF